MHGSVLTSKFIRVFTIQKGVKQSPNNQNKSLLIRKLSDFDTGIFYVSYQFEFKTAEKEKKSQ